MKIILSTILSTLLYVNLFSYDIKLNLTNNLEITEEEINILEDFKYFDKEVIIKEEISLRDLIVYRISQNEKILMLKSDIKKAKYELKRKYNVFLPTLNLNIEQSYEKNNDLVSNDPIQIYQENTNFNAKLDLDLNLYNGGKDNLNIKAAKNDLKIKNYLLKEEINVQMMEIIKSYISIIYIKRKIETSEETLKKLKKLLKITEDKEEEGDVSIGDLSSVKALYFKNKITNIEYKNQLKNEQNLYEFIVGEELSSKIPIDKNFVINIDPLKKIKEKITNNNKYQLYNVEQELNKINVKLAKSTFEPTLDLKLEYEDNRITPLNTNDFEPLHTNNYTAMLRFKMNLFNKNNDMLEYKKSLIDVQNNNFKKKYLFEELNYKSTKLFLELNAITDTLVNKEEEKNNLERMLENYWELYLNGEKNINNIIQGEKDLLNSQINILESEEKKILDFFEIKLITNEITNYFNLNIDNTYNIVKEQIINVTNNNELFKTKDNHLEKIEYIIHKRTNDKKIEDAKKIKNINKLKVIKQLKKIEIEKEKAKMKEIKKLEEFTNE